MNATKPTRITRHWSISGTLPSADQRYPNNGQNIYFGVEAETMESAMEAARAEWPSITFIGVHHRGDVHLRATATP